MDEKVKSLFEKIESLRDSIPEDEQKEMAESIIGVLREHRLTFSQAHQILDVVYSTLRVMSHSLLL